MNTCYNTYCKGDQRTWASEKCFNDELHHVKTCLGFFDQVLYTNQAEPQRRKNYGVSKVKTK